jgi:hypothetical protein
MAVVCRTLGVARSTAYLRLGRAGEAVQTVLYAGRAREKLRRLFAYLQASRDLFFVRFEQADLVLQPEFLRTTDMRRLRRPPSRTGSKLMRLHHAVERISLEKSKSMVKSRMARSVWIVAIAVAVFVVQSVPVYASCCVAADSAPRDLAAMTVCCAPGPAISCPNGTATPALNRSAAPNETAARPPATLIPTLIARDDSAPRRPAFGPLSPGRQISLPLLI